MAQLQLALAGCELFDVAVDEPLLYHDTTRSGFTALLHPSGTPRQQAIRLSELPKALRQERSRGCDLYIAQNEFFKPNRQVVNCSRLTSCYVDLDTYKLESLYGQPAEALADRLLRQCEDARLPPPSIIVYSGRGLQAKWLLERPVPRGALPRWQALQNELGRRLEPLGADFRALDASRVLRLVGSVNSRSGAVVRVVHLQRTATHGGAIGTAGVAVYPFDTFFDETLPLTRRALEEQRAEIEEFQALTNRARASVGEGKKREHPRLRLVTAKGAAGGQRILPSQLAWDRLSDLRKLAELRHGSGEGLPSGQRNLFVFLGACFLASACVAPRFREEIRALGREFSPAWSQQELAACISAVDKRIAAAARGETVEFRGRAVDARYRFRNSTLVEWLCVKDDEMPSMQTIISHEESLRRDRARKENSRRVAGRPRLCELREGRAALKVQAQQLRSQGHSWNAIAGALGISKTSARRHCAPD